MKYRPALAVLALTSMSCARTATPDPVARSSGDSPASSEAPPAASVAIVVAPARSGSATPDASANPSKPFSSSCPGVALQVSLKPASQALEIEAALRNGGTANAPLMLTGDGSSFDRRNPSVHFTLSPNDIAAVGTAA